MKDSYLTIKNASLGEYKDRGSKFLAYIYTMTKVEELNDIVEQLKKEHFKACHYCFAYRLDIEGSVFRANDDGEPSGTAGKPILGQLIKNDLTDVLIVVVRYFGGTKLGVSGLINAYKQASINAIEHVEIVEKIVVEHCKLTFDYAHMGLVMESVKVLNIEIVEKYFKEIAFIIIGIRSSRVVEQLIVLKAKLLQKQLEEITEKTIVPFCKFDFIKQA